MNILHLTLTRKWYDLIKSGEKLEEYREIKDYWVKRLAVCEGDSPVPHGYFCKKANCISCITRGNGFVSKPIDAIKFTNGYSKTSPSFLIECIGITTGLCRPEWSDNAQGEHFIIKLGKIIEE